MPKGIINTGHIARRRAEENPAQLLKQDITKLRTVANYAKMVGKTVAWIYRLGEREEIKIIKIDGVQFVKLS